jgi:hypothetical protein
VDAKDIEMALIATTKDTKFYRERFAEMLRLVADTIERGSNEGELDGRRVRVNFKLRSRMHRSTQQNDAGR